MSAYEGLLLAHVLLLVFWLGTDLGVFYSSFFVLNRSLSVETRGTMARLLLGLDLSPRICLVLMLPVGLSLAAQSGLSPLAGAWLVPVWVVALAWLAVVLAIHREHGSPLGQVLARGDTVFRTLLAAVLVTAGIWSLAAGGPFVTAWLAVKVLLFGVAVACGLGIRVLLRPFGAALGALLAGERSEQVETALAASLRRTYPLVLGIWVILVLSAGLGIAQP